MRPLKVLDGWTPTQVVLVGLALVILYTLVSMVVHILLD